MRLGTLAAFLLPAVGLCTSGLSTLTSLCITSIGSSPVASVPTSTTTETYTTSYTVTTVSTPTLTVTPPIKTALKVLTSTTTTTTNAAQQTKVFTSTTTVIDYSITSTTATYTSFFYSTSTITSTMTPTAALANGFTALGDAISAAGHSPNTAYLPNQPNAPNNQPDAVNKRKRSPETSSSFGLLPGPTGTGSSSQPSSYPIAVLCNEVVEVAVTSTVTQTGRTKTLTAKAVTSTSTSTHWLTKTSVIKPKSASTTVTTTLAITMPITTTTSTTTTSSVTSTSTSFATAPTVYPACAGNNYVTGVDGHPIWDWTIPTGYMQLTASNAQQCCIACNMLSYCAAAWYETIGSNSYCLAVTTDSCSANSFVSEFGTIPSPGCAVPVVFMNTKCGQWNFGGLGWTGPNSDTGYIGTPCGN